MMTETHTSATVTATATPSEAVPAWHGLDATQAAAGHAMDPAQPEWASVLVYGAAS